MENIMMIASMVVLLLPADVHGQGQRSQACSNCLQKYTTGITALKAVKTHWKAENWAKFCMVSKDFYQCSEAGKCSNETVFKYTVMGVKASMASNCWDDGDSKCDHLAAKNCLHNIVEAVALEKARAGGRLFLDTMCMLSKKKVSCIGLNNCNEDPYFKTAYTAATYEALSICSNAAENKKMKQDLASTTNDGVSMYLASWMTVIMTVLGTLKLM